MDRERYKAVSQIVNKIVDRLGEPVDRGIKKGVAACLYAGFITDGSCQGHMSWGLPFPWIDVLGNDDAKTRMNTYINEFYSDRLTTLHLRLNTTDYGISGDFRLQHYNGITNSGIKDKETLLYLRNEMRDFAGFLIKKTG